MQRLFKSTKIAYDMLWHQPKSVDDSVMSHPANAIAQKLFDWKHLAFTSDPKNIRFSLITDGFQPFGSMGS